MPNSLPPWTALPSGLPPASFLWDNREADCYWYRGFCANVEPPPGNWGYQLGICRSCDLRSWQMPPAQSCPP